MRTMRARKIGKQRLFLRRLKSIRPAHHGQCGKGVIDPYTDEIGASRARTRQLQAHTVPVKKLGTHARKSETPEAPGASGVETSRSDQQGP